MSLQLPLEKPAFPHRRWWNLLLKRLETARDQLPSSLQGTIQFFEKGTRDAFHLIVDGPHSRGADGTQIDAPTYVLVDGWKLSTLLRDPSRLDSVFDVSGDAELYRRFFQHLNADPSETWFSTAERTET